jgi:large subunit ribosomal protein L15
MGTGRGKYAGRGAKGAKSISGYSIMRGFEGGQMPLHRRLPKRGFTNIFHKEYTILNVADLSELEGDEFTPESLVAAGVVKKLRSGIKILGNGELTRKITVKAHVFSKSAQDKIQGAGGSFEVLASIAADAAKPASEASPEAPARKSTAGNRKGADGKTAGSKKAGKKH